MKQREFRQRQDYTKRKFLRNKEFYGIKVSTEYRVLRNIEFLRNKGIPVAPAIPNGPENGIKEQNKAQGYGSKILPD